MSLKLNCSAQGCVHNMSGLCSANNISVGGFNAHNSQSTECESFANKGFVNAFTNVVNSNIVGEMKQFVNRKDVVMSPNIKCEAVNCSYNVDELCGANNVAIHGPMARDSRETQCETFIE